MEPTDNMEPYTVIDEEEHVVKDKNGRQWAGEWQLDKMRNTDNIHVGYFDDPVRGPRQLAGLSYDSIFEHLMITGTTGYGKSTCLRNIMYQLIDDGSGLCFVDPKGVDSEMFLQQLPAHREDDVVWIEPGSIRGGIVGLNLFETGLERGDARYEQEVAEIVDEFIGHLRDVSGMWGPRMDNITNSVATQLIRADEPYNLVDFTKILTDTEEMNAFTQKYEDDLDDAFLNRVEELSQDDIDPVLRRLKKWISTKEIRQLMTHTDSQITISEAVQDGKILVVNTSNIERFDVMQIITRTVVSRVRSAIKTRDEIPMDEREPFHLCIDELDKVITPNFGITNIISQTRPLRFGVIGSFQQYSQLPGYDQTVAKSVRNMSLNASANERDASSVAQIHGVGSNRVQDLRPFEAIFKPVTKDGFESEEPFPVSLFSEVPPERDSPDPLIDKSLEKYGTRERVNTDMKDYGIDSTE